MALTLVLDLTLSDQPSTRPIEINVINATSNITFDWGDGSTPTVKPPWEISTASHSYGSTPLTNSVTITITGSTNSCEGISLKTPNGYGRGMVTSCTDFGDITKNVSFYLATNLTSVPTTLPSNMTNLTSMFYFCENFNQNIGGWITTNVTSMKNMFGYARIFNQNIGSWDTINVATMEDMFTGATVFNQNIGGWITTNVTSMKNMFGYARAFNQNIGGWITTNVTTMEDMFIGAIAFNQNIGGWITTNVTNMQDMFYGASSFNQNIGSWNIGKVTTIEGMFYSAIAFNQNLNWDTTNVVNMNAVFANATAFNGDISSWITTKVTNMQGMFYLASSFNKDISGWDTGNVNNMYWMFNKASSFNQNIGSWKTGNVNNMEMMFLGAIAFDQDISDWDISRVTTMENMFLDAKIIKRSYYDSMLTKWSVLPVVLNVKFHAGLTTKYTCGSVAEDSRNDTLIASKGWVITDGGCVSEIPETPINSGVIGSFYFGEDYTNVDISGNTLSVTFEPVSTVISINMDNLLKDISTITLNVINRSDYVTAQDTLFVDFVAKRRNSDTYPKFCKCDDSICTIDDKAIYDKAIIGGDPIIVDFSACTNAVGTHTDYKPIEYHWYFDYGTYPNDYEITTEPYATHTYCGGYLEAFDVKLCVQFA